MYRVCFPINKPNPVWFYDKQIPYPSPILGGEKNAISSSAENAVWCWMKLWMGKMSTVCCFCFFLLSFVVKQSTPLFTARLHCAGVKQTDGNASSQWIRHQGGGERPRWREWHRTKRETEGGRVQGQAKRLPGNRCLTATIFQWHLPPSLQVTAQWSRSTFQRHN